VTDARKLEQSDEALPRLEVTLMARRQLSALHVALFSSTPAEAVFMAKRSRAEEVFIAEERCIVSLMRRARSWLLKIKVLRSRVII
jgi:hypothetical protein